MSGEIARARNLLQERKLAAGLDQCLEKDDIKAAMRRWLSGLDIDMDELQEQLEEIRKVSLLGSLIGGSGPGLAGAVQFADGLVVGLLIAEARRREEQTA